MDKCKKWLLEYICSPELQKAGYRLVDDGKSVKITCYDSDTGVFLNPETVSIYVPEGEEAIDDEFSYDEISLISRALTDCLGDSITSYMQYLWNTLPKQYLCLTLEDSVYVILYNGNFPEDVEACAENALLDDFGESSIPEILEGYHANSCINTTNLFRFRTLEEKKRFFEENKVEVLIPSEDSEVYDLLNAYVN